MEWSVTHAPSSNIHIQFDPLFQKNQRNSITSGLTISNISTHVLLVGGLGNLAKARDGCFGLPNSGGNCGCVFAPFTNFLAYLSDHIILLFCRIYQSIARAFPFSTSARDSIACSCVKALKWTFESARLLLVNLRFLKDPTTSFSRALLFDRAISRSNAS